MAAPMPQGHIGVVTGAALYVGALIGPGLLLVPALGVEAAGPASILAWVGLLITHRHDLGAAPQLFLISI